MRTLSAEDRRVITRAHEVLSAEHGYEPADLAARIGALEWHLGEMLRLAERTGGEGQAAEDTRRLAEIRALLAQFDWEYHDRQLALAAIERIVEDGHA